MPSLGTLELGAWRGLSEQILDRSISDLPSAFASLWGRPVTCALDVKVALNLVTAPLQPDGRLDWKRLNQVHDADHFCVHKSQQGTR